MSPRLRLSPVSQPQQGHLLDDPSHEFAMLCVALHLVSLPKPYIIAYASCLERWWILYACPTQVRCTQGQLAIADEVSNGWGYRFCSLTEVTQRGASTRPRVGGEMLGVSKQYSSPLLRSTKAEMLATLCSMPVGSLLLSFCHGGSYIQPSETHPARCSQALPHLQVPASWNSRKTRGYGVPCQHSLWSRQ